MRGAAVFTISPGVDLLATFARALFNNEIVPGCSGASDPLALARATVYVPTQRSRAALAASS